ncbi:MAG: hypothetical protein ACREN6_11285 [Gemmatimonadaceae bacterium]
MNPVVLDIVEVLAAICVLAACINVFGRASALVFERLRARTPPRPEVGDDRLRHLEQAVDAIAVEVERISEAQRFSAKLLAGREPEAAKKLTT